MQGASEYQIRKCGCEQPNVCRKYGCPMPDRMIDSKNLLAFLVLLLGLACLSVAITVGIAFIVWELYAYFGG